MCFSFEADLTAAVVLAPLGVATLRATRTRPELLLGALPAVFATHQFIESFVWLGTDGRVPESVGHAATILYLAIAQVLLPVLVPLGALVIEPEQRRRRLMGIPLAVGAVTATWFAYTLIAHQVGAAPVDHAMTYDTDIHIGLGPTAGYIVATCGAILMSSRQFLFAMGLANVAGVGLAALVRYEAVTSVWCVYAAFASVLLLVHFRAEHATASQPAPSRQALAKD